MPPKRDDDRNLDPRFRGDDTIEIPRKARDDPAKAGSLSYVREERHETGALDGLRQLSLMFGADAGMLGIDHLCLA